MLSLHKYFFNVRLLTLFAIEVLFMICYNVLVSDQMIENPFICDMGKGNELHVEDFNFEIITSLCGDLKMLHFDTNPIS